MNWNNLIAALPGAHVLQSEEWGQVKARIGWKAIPIIWTRQGSSFQMRNFYPGIESGELAAETARPLVDAANPVAAALVLQRTLPIAGFAAKLRLLYVSKGPLLDWNDPTLRRQVLEDLARLARRQGAIFIKIDPDVRLGVGAPGTPQAREDSLGQAVADQLVSQGWRFSGEQIQFRNTILVDLNCVEEDLLARMKSKTRYNIRLAERKGVVVRPAGFQDLSLLYRMYAETSLRDGFVIRDQEYYLFAWQTFLRAGLAEAFLAEVDGEAAAGLIIFCFAGKAWYMFGMSRQVHRDKMPNHLLQWQAILHAKAAGCGVYDLWGAPDVFNETDSMWGVYRFKEGLGGTVIRHLGAWDLPIQPLLYKLYTQVLPRLLDRMRQRGKERTRKIAQGL